MLALIFGLLHVPTWIYGSFDGYNTDWSASMLARYATFAEFSEYDLPRLADYKRVGGAHAAVYIDPSFVPYCTPPFAPPAGECKGPFGDQHPSESAWLHQANGERIHRQDAYTHEYQEALNPASAETRAIVRARTQRMLAQTSIDLFFTDDSGSSLTGPDDTSSSGLYYGFDQPSDDLRSDAEWIAGEEALFTAIARPVILNGGDATTWLPSYGGAFLRSANVAGASREGCFSNGSGPMTSEYSRWQKTANALIATTGLQRYAVCMETGSPDPAIRTYDFASWLLTYDPRWSVLAPIWETADHHNVFPEITIVPEHPLDSARTNIESLQIGDVYVRSFATCTANDASIGGCAVAVNPTDDPAILPTSFSRYHTILRLDSRTIDANESLTWSPWNPGTLGAHEAILVAEAH